MKVFIKCKSPLLEKTLKIYLKDFEVNDIKSADICISDAKFKNHKTFLIGKNIKHPFTKDMLLFEIKKFLDHDKKSHLEQEVSKALNEIKNIQNKKIQKIIKKLK